MKKKNYIKPEAQVLDFKINKLVIVKICKNCVYYDMHKNGTCKFYNDKTKAMKNGCENFVGCL